MNPDVVDITSQVIANQRKQERERAKNRKTGGGGKYHDWFPWHPNKEERQGGLRHARNTGRLFAFNTLVTEEIARLRTALGHPYNMGIEDWTPLIGRTVRNVAVPIVVYKRWNRTGGKNSSESYIGLGYAKRPDGEYVCPFYRGLRNKSSKLKPEHWYAVNIMPTKPEDVDRGVLAVMLRTEWAGRRSKDQGQVCYGLRDLYAGYTPPEQEEGGQLAEGDEPIGGSAVTKLGLLQPYGDQMVGGKGRDIAVYKRVEQFSMGEGLALDLNTPSPVTLAKPEDSMDLTAYEDSVTDLLTDPRFQPGWSDNPDSVFHDQIDVYLQQLAQAGTTSAEPPAEEAKTPDKGTLCRWTNGGVDYVGTLRDYGPEKCTLLVYKEANQPPAQEQIQALIDKGHVDQFDPNAVRVTVPTALLQF